MSGSTSTDSNGGFHVAHVQFGSGFCLNFFFFLSIFEFNIDFAAASARGMQGGVLLEFHLSVVCSSSVIYNRARV